MESVATRRVVDVTVDECVDLLASAPLGRLAVIVDGHPEIFPVNHVVDRASGTVVFATTAGTTLSAAVGGPPVAFEVDGVSDDGRRGWSVLVVGRAEELVDGELVAGLAAAPRPGWRPAGPARWVRIVPTRITGRRLCGMDR